MYENLICFFGFVFVWPVAPGGCTATGIGSRNYLFPEVNVQLPAAGTWWMRGTASTPRMLSLAIRQKPGDITCTVNQYAAGEAVSAAHTGSRHHASAGN